MKNFLKVTGFKTVLLAALLIALGLSPAFAHNALIYTDKATAPVGTEVEIGTSTSGGPFGTPDMPFLSNANLDYDYGPVKVVVFDGGKAADIDMSLCGSNDGEKKKLSEQEIEAAFNEVKKGNPDLASWAVMPKVFNSNLGTHKVASEGTVTIVGCSVYGKQTAVKNLMKTYVNLKADGESRVARAQHLGFDGIELMPVDDLATVRPGGTVKVQAVLDGKPQSGVIVYSGAKGLPESERICNIDNYLEMHEPYHDAGVTDRDGFVTLKLPNLFGGAKELRDVYILTEGHLTIAPKVRYRSTITFNIGE